MVGRIVIEYRPNLSPKIRPKLRIEVTTQLPLKDGVKKMVKLFILNTTANHGLRSCK